LREVKEYLIKRHGAIVANMCNPNTDLDNLPEYSASASMEEPAFETDDMVAMIAYHLKGVQATLDKDSFQCNGTLMYVWDKMDEPFEIPEKGVGKIWLDEKGKVRAYGLKSLCMQMLIGDPVDTINPKKLAGVKWGEKKALELLDPLTTPKECLRAVVDTYKEWYPEPVTYEHWETGEELTKDWLQIAEEMFVLLWMRRFPKDSTTFYKLMKEYRVK
jgi:hypothetical protein